MLRSLLISSLLVAGALPAAAQPKVPRENNDPAPPAASSRPAPAPEPPNAAGEPTHTSKSVAGEPVPAAASGVARGPERKGEAALWIPRILLFPIRAVVEVVDLPIRGTMYAYEVYQLGPRAKSIFFNEEGTAGIFPVALVETGFGLNAGGRLVLRRLGDSDFGFSGRASFGGRFRQIYSAKVSSKDTWRRLELDLASEFESRPKDFFFGIGNGDLDEAPQGGPIDPRAGEARRSRFQQDAIRVRAAAAYRPTSRFRALVSGAFNRRRFEDSDEEEADERLTANFDPAAVSGFDDGTSSIYGELELTYDTRRSPTRWEGASTPSTGWLVQAYAGYATGLGSDDVTGYARYGFDGQYLLRIAEAPRVLALRLYLEGVTGGYDDISFYDLPKLGGPLILRGHDQDRFRDRVAAMGSAEYQFDLVTNLGGFLFADVGRVFPDIDDVEPTDLRLGFGGGIEIHSQNSFLGRLTLSSSVEGGFFATVSFDPVYDVKARVERK